MGADAHERIVSLDEDTRYGVFVEGVRQGQPRRYTPEEAWRIVYDQEGYEDGHSYSGTFGSKGGMVVMATSDKLDKELVAMAGELVRFFNLESFDQSGEWDPRKKEATAAAATKVIEILGEAALRRAAQVYEDKWGPAVAIVGKDHVWFGGYCSS